VPAPVLARSPRLTFAFALAALLGCAPAPRRIAPGAPPELRWYRDLPIADAGGDDPVVHVDPGGGLWVAVTGLADATGRSRLFHRPSGGAWRTLHEGPFATELSLGSLRAGEVYLGYTRPLEGFEPTLLRVSPDGEAPLPTPRVRVDELEFLQMGGYAMLSETEGFACGQRGTLFRLAEGRWSAAPPVLPWKPGDPTNRSLCCSIHLDGPRRGFVVDREGDGAAWDGDAWRPIPREDGLALLSPASGLARAGASLARHDGRAWRRLAGPLGPDAASAPLVFDPAGRWAAHAGGVVEIGADAARALPGRLPFKPRAIAEADGALWALGADGVYRATRADVATFAAPGAGAPAPGLAYPIAVDLDQDGDEDLLGLRAPPGELSGGKAALVVALNDGAGHFTQASLGLPDDVFLWRDHVDVGDVDGDGDLDVVLVTSAGVVELWLQDGGRFSRAWSRPAAGAMVALVDIDGDGDLDLGLLPAVPGLWLNDGAGHFTEGPALPLPATPIEHATWADVDGDGDVDVLLQRWRDPAFLLLNTGAGFELVELPVVAEGAAVADTDVDGLPEILAQKLHYRAVALPFARCRLDGKVCRPDAGPRVPAGLVVDLNLDGRPDVIVTDLRGDETMTSDGEVHLATPDGYQRVTEITGAMPRPTAIDVDGDGDPDVYSTTIGLRLNTSDPVSFLRVRPRASRSDRRARGAVVIARRAGVIVASARADFGVATLGLPDAAAVYDLEVRFPAGERRVIAGLAAGTDLTVRDLEGPAYPARLGLLWASGTWKRARPLRELGALGALAVILLATARRRARAPLFAPLFGVAYLGLAGFLLRQPGPAPWLLAPASAAIAAAGQGLGYLRARRRAQRHAGPYLLREKLGGGASATVWRARAGKSDIALKIFSAESMSSPEARERFFREARVGSEIKHPNVVRIRDAGELEDGRCYLAMELVEGRSLGDLLGERGRLPAATAAAVGLDVARALVALHAADIVHRDVKPENVMVRPDGRAVLTDLGLARSALFRTMTRHDVAVGTLAYMSPEQCVGRPLDGRSDLWSLGVSLHEMLTGAKAFDARHELELVYVIHNVDPPPPSTLVAGVAPALDAIVLRCLARAPELRFGSAQELADALAAVLATSAPGDLTTGVLADAGSGTLRPPA
jgi:serine/threonine-protein kinase